MFYKTRIVNGVYQARCEAYVHRYSILDRKLRNLIEAATRCGDIFQSQYNGKLIVEEDFYIRLTDK